MTQLLKVDQRVIKETKLFFSKCITQGNVAATTWSSEHKLN